MNEPFSLDDTGTPLRKIPFLQAFHRYLLDHDPPYVLYDFQKIVLTCIRNLHRIPRKIQHKPERHCRLPLLLEILNNYLTSPAVTVHFKERRVARVKSSENARRQVVVYIKSYAPNHCLYEISHPDYDRMMTIVDNKIVFGSEIVGEVSETITDSNRLVRMFEELEILLVSEVIE
jgi:hypothetical protein